ncbi:hypothetical protein STEG23_036526, partial [Scotinomys teguina]
KEYAGTLMGIEEEEFQVKENDVALIREDTDPPRNMDCQSFGELQDGGYQSSGTTSSILQIQRSQGSDAEDLIGTSIRRGASLVSLLLKGKYSVCSQVLLQEAGEMTRQLKAHLALQDDLSSVLSIHINWILTTCNFSFKFITSFLFSLRILKEKSAMNFKQSKKRKPFPPQDIFVHEIVLDDKQHSVTNQERKKKLKESKSMDLITAVFWL